ncbi:protein DESIGUAL 3-like [Impatiens glandulifera]|uniref:protein DESIGUAL 3-like n=1 Tax=Impatiens glandulifera TaxID=253017 RepID=UPI001FB0AF9A|nr:protein DESIGUAL 3-like [Impatiens glandulifera]
MKMWKKYGIIACIAVVAMDIAAGILALKAEATQDQVKHLRLWMFECKDPSNQAYKLGLAAVVLLSLSHALANFIGGCSSCSMNSSSSFRSSAPSKQCSLACLVLTWVVLVVGLYLLISGIRSNNNSQTSCGFSHPHFLSIGAISCFVHAAFSVSYCLTSTIATHHSTPII